MAQIKEDQKITCPFLLTVHIELNEIPRGGAWLRLSPCAIVTLHFYYKWTFQWFYHLLKSTFKLQRWVTKHLWFLMTINRVNWSTDNIEILIIAALMGWLKRRRFQAHCSSCSAKVSNLAHGKDGYHCKLTVFHDPVKPCLVLLFSWFLLFIFHYISLLCSSPACLPFNTVASPANQLLSSFIISFTSPELLSLHLILSSVSIF